MYYALRWYKPRGHVSYLFRSKACPELDSLFSILSKLDIYMPKNIKITGSLVINPALHFCWQNIK